MLRVIVQYLLSPIVFPLTFILPVVFFFVSRKYAWFSILLTVLVEIIINWGNFCYYESRGLMIFVRASFLSFSIAEQGVPLINQFKPLKANGYKAEAHYCSNCKVIIAPTKN